MKSKKKFLVVAALLTFVLTAIFVGWIWRNLEIQQAKNLTWAARHFMRPDLDLSEDSYREYDIPRALTSKDDIAVYFLLRSIDVGYVQYSGAYYVLGRFFLERNCEVSEYYFSLHYDAVNDDEILAILNTIQKEGCAAAKDRFFSSNSVRGTTRQESKTHLSGRTTGGS